MPSPFSPAIIPSGTLSVLGPLQVSFDTAGITTTGVTLHTFRAATLVIGSFVFASTPWAGANPIAFEVTAGADAANPVNNAPLWTTGDLADGTSQPTFTKWPYTVPSTNAVIVAAAGVLGADAFGVAGMTAGVAQVYALIAAL